jgi:hypothetical protein
MILFGNYGPSTWHLRGGTLATFRPTGRMVFTGRNPDQTTHGEIIIKTRGNETLQARIVVGLNTAGKPRWRLRDVQRVVLAQKHAAGLGAGASFLMQYGIYQEKHGDKIDRERSVQIILLNLFDGLSQRAFLTHIRRLAETLRIKLNQDAVLVQVTHAGRIVPGGEWQDRRPVRALKSR